MNETMTLGDYFAELRTATILAGKEVLTLKEAAIFTGYSESHLKHLKMNGEVPCYKSGKYIYFRKSELEQWMTRNRIRTRDEVLRDYERNRRVKISKANQ